MIGGEQRAHVLRVEPPARAVKPTRSAKSTATIFRSSRPNRKRRRVSAEPQNGQKGNSPGNSLRQSGQVTW